MFNSRVADSQKTMLVNEFLPPMQRWVMVSNLVLISGLCSAFILSSVTKYNVIVKTTAIVRPVGELKIVQAAIEGTISHIRASENAPVSKDSEIASIDITQYETKRSQLEGRIRQGRLQITQLQAELKSRESAGSIAGKEAQASIDLAQSELAAAEKLAEAGAIAKLIVQQKQQAYETAQSKLEQVQPLLDQQTATLSRSRLEIQNQIEQDQKEIQQLENSIQKSKITSPVDGTIQKINLRNLGQFIRAGDEVAQILPSTTTLVIKAKVPTEDIRKVKICQAQRVEQCTEGKAELQVSAFPYPDYGILKGAVAEVSPDAIIPKRDPAGNQSELDVSPYYEATIRLEKPYFEVKGQRYPLKPGMSVNASIISEEETFLSFVMRKAKLLSNT